MTGFFPCPYSKCILHSPYGFKRNGDVGNMYPNPASCLSNTLSLLLFHVIPVQFGHKAPSEKAQKISPRTLRTMDAREAECKACQAPSLILVFTGRLDSDLPRRLLARNMKLDFIAVTRDVLGGALFELSRIVRFLFSLLCHLRRIWLGVPALMLLKYA
ncbi:hypothetical protein AVEN_18433-1 [Araneus ventricosus]|uniref:Uncharacterized protein n=1 Tax=Araneus ventricosus TaxID=182803 RepID=A0A4Y2GAE3_ARAVE|nr:hypothetical protein AVEN_18433-1 [Araneus ventricosus]